MTNSVDSGVDMTQVRSIVDRAIKAAVPPGQMTTDKYGFAEPQPLAGLQAALTVARLAQAEAYKYAKGLRGEGTSWAEVADLLDIPWSQDYHRTERAFELVAGPESSYGYDRYVSFTCGGPLGCGERITDRGPYNGWPSDNEDGHAEGCRRAAAECEAYERKRDADDERARVMDEAMPQVTDSFGKETVQRVRYVQSHGGRYLGWSTSEALAVALVLRDAEQLEAQGYSTEQAALDRIMSGMGRRPADPDAWITLMRAAATGVR